VFFSIDGGDGVGKSTQVALLCQWLTQLGYAVVSCRDPGSTRLGEAVRELLLHRQDLHPTRRSEMLLYMAARAQLADEVIRPALHQGRIVVSDRYLLANVVYQGYGGGLDVEALWQVGEIATGGVMPELTLLLDMPAEAALARIARTHDRMEQQGLEFHRRVREGFLKEAQRQPDRIVVIDADRPVQLVQADIRAAVGKRLGRKG